MIFTLLGCPTLVLERKSDKLESKGRKMYIYVGYPKGIPEDYFSIHKDNKVVVKSNTKFLDNDYVNNLKTKRRIVLKEKC